MINSVRLHTSAVSWTSHLHSQGNALHRCETSADHFALPQTWYHTVRRDNIGKSPLISLTARNRPGLIVNSSDVFSRRRAWTACRVVPTTCVTPGCAETDWYLLVVVSCSILRSFSKWNPSKKRRMITNIEELRQKHDSWRDKPDVERPLEREPWSTLRAVWGTA